MSTGVRILLVKEDNWWIAKDEESGVVSQGRTRESALTNLDEALRGYHGEGDPPTEEDLRAAGIDPENNVPTSIADSEIFE